MPTAIRERREECLTSIVLYDQGKELEVIVRRKRPGSGGRRFISFKIHPGLLRKGTRKGEKKVLAEPSYWVGYLPKRNRRRR